MSKLQCFCGHDPSTIVQHGTFLIRVFLLVDTSNGMAYASRNAWSRSRIQRRGASGLFGSNIDKYIDFLAVNPDKVWEIEIKD
jgi:hypothetical protein